MEEEGREEKVREEEEEEEVREEKVREEEEEERSHNHAL